jgi:hypothetical protein
MKKHTLVLALLFGAAVMRLLPHLPNVTPLCAMGLFGAAYLSKRYYAVIVPFLALFLSDLVLNNIIYKSYFTQFQWFTSGWMYLALAAVIGVGFLRLRQISPRNIILASILGSIVFFLISNIWSWQWDPMYTKDAAGLITAYVAGLPFLGYSIAGDLFYSTILFGAMELAQRKQLVAA